MLILNYELTNNSMKFTAWQESMRFRFELQGDSRDEADAMVCVNDNRKVPFVTDNTKHFYHNSKLYKN